MQTMVENATTGLLTALINRNNTTLKTAHQSTPAMLSALPGLLQRDHACITSLTGSCPQG